MLEVYFVMYTVVVERRTNTRMLANHCVLNHTPVKMHSPLVTLV